MSIEWKISLETALSWLFSGGVLYLVYRFGYHMGHEEGLKRQSWQALTLLLGFVLALGIAARDHPTSPLESLKEAFYIDMSVEHASRFVGILIIAVATYVAGYVDGRSKRPA
jgi:hypothetical protein